MDPDKFEALANDPVFVKAAKALVANRKAADERGVTIPMTTPNKQVPFSENDIVQKFSGGKYSRGDVDTWLSQAAKPSFQNVLQKVGQGITFNFLDELRGKAKGQTAEDAMRLQEGASDAQNPGLSLAGTTVGSLMNPINLALMAATGGTSEAVEPAVAAKVPALLKALGLGGSAGAVEGGLYGAGEGTTPKSRIAGAETGAEVGGITGAALPVAGAATKLLKNTVASPADNAYAALARRAKLLGRDKLVGAATDLTDAGIDPILGDLPGMTGMHDIATNTDLPTRDATQAIVDARRAAAPGQVRDALADNLPEGVGTDLGTTETSMQAATRNKFEPLYADIDAMAPQVGGSPEAVLGGKPTVADVAQNPVHPQHQDAIQMLANDPAQGPKPMPGAAEIPPDPAYAPLAKLMKRDPEVQAAWSSALRDAQMGDTPDMGRPSVSMLRNMREKLQDRVENMFRSGLNNAAFRLKTSIQTLNGVLDNETGGAAAGVDAQYRAAMDAQRALRNGRAWWNASSSGDDYSLTGLKAQMSAMTPEELEAFRTGVASSITHDLEHASVNKNVAQGIKNWSDYRQGLLQSVFDNGSQLQRFKNKVDALAQSAKLASTTSGSQTAMRGAQAAEGAPALSATDVAQPVNMLRKLGQVTMGDGVAPASQAFGAGMGKLTMTRGTPAIDELLQKMLEAPNGVPSFLQNPAAAGAAGAVGGAAGAQP